MTLTAQVLRVLAQGQELTRDELADVIGSTEHQVKKALESLIAQGKLQRIVTATKYGVTLEGANCAARPPTAKALEMRRFRAKQKNVKCETEAVPATRSREVANRLADGIIESAMRTRPAMETAWMGATA